MHSDRKRVHDYRGDSPPKRSRHEDEYGHRGRSPPRSLVPDYVTRVLVGASQLARIIGRGGAQINTIRQNCGIRMETIDLPGDERMVVLIGSLRGINDGIGMVVRCLEDPIHEVEPFRMTVLVPSDKAGLVVGAKGAVVKEIKAKTGVEDFIIGHRDDVKRVDDSYGSHELRICHIIGEPRAVVKAHALMSEKVYGVSEEFDERQREQVAFDRRPPHADPYPPRAAPELLPPPAHAPVHHSLAGENDRLLDLHRVPALIGREVDQLQQALTPYGLEIQLVPVARRRDDSRERNFPRAAYDVRDVRYEPYRTMEPPSRDHGRGRSPVRGGDFRDRDYPPAFRRDRSRSVDRHPPPVRRDETETRFTIPADKAGAIIGKQGVACKKIENEFRVKISVAKDSANGERSVVITGAEPDTQAARARIEHIITTIPDRTAPREHRNDSGTPQSTPQHDPRHSDAPSAGLEGGYGYSLEPYGSSSLASHYGGGYGDSLSYSAADHSASLGPQGAAASSYASWDADVVSRTSQGSEHASHT